ncbi:hypothetical protein AT959_06730 [Dechloromonas denitrificans]|uniref:Uncharacterized protein n=1 Tax=Dechloromonas denitrificans TaxID=281362 RepID=A0A133XKA2_9RHOO|nr:hypothetical protein [Dechloromonas denitrificans]KXB31363.1 hypothetical protein AT959_06730 [Dechloromonas denitrificans]
MPASPRLILLHKHGTSGRLRFLCLSSGVVAFLPLPALAALRDEGYSPTLQFHPTALIREAEIHLGLPEGRIEPVADFQAWVDTPAGDVPVLLAAFTGIDPPFTAAEQSGGRFIAITESRQLSELERNLLRRAYEHVLG